jgi:MoaA/NifB/PqqE/SkfB family radical SAM enzyme
MKNCFAEPQEWLTDAGLTPAGKMARKTFAQFANYTHNLPIPLYRASRSLHLLQSCSSGTSPDGYSLPPHTINFCVNNSCNLSCAYCDLNHGRKGDLDLNTKVRHNVIDSKKLYELPLETCKRIIDESAWYKPTIRVPWMEPLLYRNLMPLIEYTKQKGLPFSMLTNGLLLPKHARRLAAAGVDALRVSLDGPGEVHDSLCGVKGAYEQILSGLKILAEERKRSNLSLQIGCYYTVNDKNHHTMVDFLKDLERHRLLDEMFVGFYMFNYISKKMAANHNREHATICGATVEETSAQYADLAAIDVEAILRQREAIEEQFISKGARIHFRPDFTESNLRFLLVDDSEIFPGSRCETHWHTLYVNPKGDVKPLPQCILNPCGNVNEQSLLDVWNGQEMRKQRILMREHGAFYGCMRCWSIYSNIEDIQNSWHDNTDRKVASHG